MKSIVKLFCLVTVWVAMTYGTFTLAQAQVFYFTTFSNVIVQSTTNVVGPYMTAFTLPVVTLINGFEDDPGYVFYFRFRLNEDVTSLDSMTIISLSLTFQQSLVGVNGPYTDFSTQHITTLTNLPVNTFYRSSFTPSDTNFISIDSTTVGWVLPY
jgi:hypothetical protein